MPLSIDREAVFQIKAFMLWHFNPTSQFIAGGFSSSYMDIIKKKNLKWLTHQRRRHYDALVQSLFNAEVNPHSYYSVCKEYRNHYWYCNVWHAHHLSNAFVVLQLNHNNKVNFSNLSIKTNHNSVMLCLIFSVYGLGVHHFMT